MKNGDACLEKAEIWNSDDPNVGRILAEFRGGTENRRYGDDSSKKSKKTSFSIVIPISAANLKQVALRNALVGGSREQRPSRRENPIGGKNKKTSILCALLTE